jgi:hypothetical protein
MRFACHFAFCLACLFLATPSRAETPNLLRLVPDQADLLVKLEQPRTLVETVLHHPLIKDLYQIDAIRDFYGSTNVRRFDQLIAYFEKQLGLGRLELLDRLAGGGAALAVKFQKEPPVLLIVQAKDEQMLRRFFTLGLEVLEQELARQEAKDRPEKSNYRGIETVAIGKEFHAAVVGSALVMSNQTHGLHGAIDQHLDGGKKSLARVASVADARRMANPDPLLWMWLNMETLRKAPGAKEIFTTKQAALTVVAGPFLDLARRSPFVCAGVYPREHGFVLSLRMPRGREGMPAELSALLPSAGEPGSRPLLTPQGVMYSTSYFLDLARLWENRAKLLDAPQLKKLEDFDKNSGRFLAGTRMSQLLTQAGPYQRLVVAHPARSGYQTKPAQYIPAFAWVLEMREPESFSKRAETILRGAALLATTQVPLNLVEEKQGQRRIIGYRFREEEKFKGDPNGLRFNFSPCFVAVGNQLMLCSTLELCHELIDLLDKEAAQPKLTASPPVHTRIYASGGAALLNTFKDRLFTQTILEQAIPPERAKEQVQAFTEWVRRLGIFQEEADYGPQDFRYDFELKLGDGR